MSDGRIPVVIGGAAGDGDAVLLEGEGPLPPGAASARFTLAGGGHAIGCACCVPRSDAGRALGRLFLARARGEVAAFGRVVVVASEEGRAAVEAAVGGDVLASARFRMG